MKLLKTLRNNWKKSLFAFATISYGTYYLIERKHTGDLFQAYCYEALKYSREKVNPETKIKRVTVFLNPIANQESSKYQYDKNVAPLLNLSGLDVKLIRLDKNTEANEYMKQLDISETDCIVIAGGNATLNECITGLMSRADSNQVLERIPIGIIPLGNTNTFSKKWFMMGSDETDETELRLLADSAMSIIRGKTTPASLMKVTLTQNVPSDSQQLEKAEEENTLKGTSYKLLKEEKLYALSTISAGFVTETDAYLNSYKYFWKLKSHMNRYFMARHLRRQPINFKLDYKLKCNGCSNCLNETELKTKLNNLISRKEPNMNKISQKETTNDSFIQVFFRKFFSPGKFTLKETPQQIESRLKEKIFFENLIEKSKINNEKCGKLFETNLIQSEVIANINDPCTTNQTDSESDGIQTVFVTDPEFNAKRMFLAERRNLSELQLKKLNLNPKNISFKNAEDNLDNIFCVEIDGEIYKLNNLPANNLTVKVELVENCFNLLAHDQKLSQSINVNHVPKTYLLKDSNQTDDIPLIRPFQKLYYNYWNRL